jgi:hypothetical protein
MLELIKTVSRRMSIYTCRTIFVSFLLFLNFPAQASLSCQELLQASLGNQSQVKLTVEKFADGPEISYNLRRHIDAIGKVALALRERGLSARRVFYPAAGYDAATPVLLFPDAIEIVAVDLAPFHRPSSHSIEAEEGNQLGGTFIANLDSMASESVAGFIVRRLSLAVPGFRLLSINKWTSRDNRGNTSSNGVIEYDSGVGTQVRRYIHIQDFISSLDTTWGNLLTANEFDGVIVKGLDLNMSTEISVQMKAAIYQELRKNKGVLIEDYGFGGRGWMTGGEIPEGSTRETLNLIFGHAAASIVSFREKNK